MWQLILSLVTTSTLWSNRVMAQPEKIDPIEIKGAKFFNSRTGDQFFIKGVAYQPRGKGNSDPLADPEGCKRDAELLKELGANTIRVYEAYPEKNHDECMKAFAEKGIYLMLDLAIPEKSINRESPRYDTVIYEHFKANIDAFAKYDNTLGFFAGNEVTNDKGNTKASAYVKAALRDAKEYMRSKSRIIPVGYADNDDPDIRANIQAYFNCGEEFEMADFYGINIYSWCGESSFEESGYNERTSELENYSRPVLLSEYGCNKVKPRPFTEIEALYGEEMSQVFSGGFVYEYSQEENDYGLVKITDGKAEKLDDFENVKKHMTQVKPKLLDKDAYNPVLGNSGCPKVDDNWESSFQLPLTPSTEACLCAFRALECKLTSKGDSRENGKAVGEKVGQACENDHCFLIRSDPLSGDYGPFSFCNTTIASSIVFNAASKEGGTCDFDGFASASTSDGGNLDACANETDGLPEKEEPASQEDEEQSDDGKSSTEQDENQSADSGNSDKVIDENGASGRSSNSNESYKNNEPSIQGRKPTKCMIEKKQKRKCPAKKLAKA